LIAFVLVLSGSAAASPRWILTYGRQYGEFLTGGVAGQAELFTHDERGRSKRVGLTNRYNQNSAIFGQTDAFGNARVIFDPHNQAYDFHVFDPPVPSDSSPDCFWVDGLPRYGHYRFEFHWRKISNPEEVKAFPFDPIYHYDLVKGFNTRSGSEPAGFSSDGYELTNWADYQAQTFVVPEGQNRIIAAKAFCVRQHGTKFTMRATIRKGGPTGPQVGPAVTSREVFSNEFPNVLMTWSIDAVPVTPGETYALRLEATDGQGFNVYSTKRDNYTEGMLYNGSSPQRNRDMIAVVIGLWVEPPGTPFIRGDCNQDLNIDVADAITVLAYLFQSGKVDCLTACDTDATDALDIADAVYLLTHLFAAGPPPPPPFPTCAPEPTPDTLPCENPVCG